LDKLKKILTHYFLEIDIRGGRWRAERFSNISDEFE